MTYPKRLPSGKWEVRWRSDDGRHRKRTFDKGEKKLAQAFYEEIRTAKRHGHLTRLQGQLEGGRKPLADIGEEWWGAHSSNIQPKTQKLYLWLWNRHVLPTLGAAPIGSLTTRDIERWIAQMETGVVAKRKAIALLSQVYDAARRWGYVRENPVELAPKPKMPRKTAVRAHSPLDVERIRFKLAERKRPEDAVLVSVLAYAGLRPQEALALAWSDVRSRTIVIDAPKTGRSRAVEIVAPLASDLAELRMASEPRTVVFPNRRGQQWTETQWGNWRARVWTGTKDKPGVAPKGMRPYDLRHVFVSLLIQEGRSVVEVARQAGHSPQVCLSTYAHEFDEHDMEGTAADMIREARAEVFGSRLEEATG